MHQPMQSQLSVSIQRGLIISASSLASRGSLTLDSSSEVMPAPGSFLLALLPALVLQMHPVGSCVEELLARTDASEYGYTAFNGPATWSRRFAACGGPRQSPVALEACEEVVLPPLVFQGHADFRPDGFRLHNTFQSVEVQFSGPAATLLGGPLGEANFTLVQVHFHWGADGQHGSEHSVRGVFHALEAHLVHVNARYASTERAARHPDGLAVVSLLLQESSTDNSELRPLTSRLSRVRRGGSYTLAGGEAMAWLREPLEAASYFAYPGSLTTPPCTSPITWIVLETTSHVGTEQLRRFRRLRGHVSRLSTVRRPQQPLRGRPVFCSRGTLRPDQRRDNLWVR